jgi:hypothetical protein
VSSGLSGRRVRASSIAAIAAGRSPLCSAAPASSASRVLVAGVRADRVGEPAPRGVGVAVDEQALRADALARHGRLLAGGAAAALPAGRRPRDRGAERDHRRSGPRRSRTRSPARCRAAARPCGSA